MNHAGNLPFLAVLMAGGGGTRLWPLSRRKRPKQVLPLLAGRSLFSRTVDRLLSFLPAEHLFVITNDLLVESLAESAPDLPRGNFICEPSPRNTAPAIAYAQTVLQSRFPVFLTAVLPSDHYIGNVEEFQGLMRAAGALADQGTMVTLGIEPTEPNTGYGYLELGERLDSVQGKEVFRVRRFKEKPDREEANEMLSRGGYLWNSGMFFWRSDVLEDEIRRQLPSMAESMDRIRKALVRRGKEGEIHTAWKAMPVLSIDYAVMEHARSVCALPARDLEWTDIGNWDSLLALYQRKPELRFQEKGKHVEIESEGVTIFNEEDSSRLMATVGIDDVIVVQTRDAVLICRKGKSQTVRNVVDRLKQSNDPCL